MAGEELLAVHTKQFIVELSGGKKNWEKLALRSEIQALHSVLCTSFCPLKVPYPTPNLKRKIKIKFTAKCSVTQI